MLDKNNLKEIKKVFHLAIGIESWKLAYNSLATYSVVTLNDFRRLSVITSIRGIS